MADDSKPREPVSEFIRSRIIAMKTESGITYKALAKSANLAPSMLSQIIARTSDATFYSAGRLARPLGFRDVPTLVSAAYAAWHKSPAVADDEPYPALAAAVRIGLEWGITAAQVDRALKRYPPAQFGAMDEFWWLSRLHEERSYDVKIDGLTKASKGFDEKIMRFKKSKSRDAWNSRRPRVEAGLTAEKKALRQAESRAATTASEPTLPEVSLTPQRGRKSGR